MRWLISCAALQPPSVDKNKTMRVELLFRFTNMETLSEDTQANIRRSQKRVKSS